VKKLPLELVQQLVDKFIPLKIMTRKKVIAISGSTREKSINHSLIRAISNLAAQHIEMTIYNGIGALPQFNPDHDGEHVAQEVADFRQQLDRADGILICTPEYAHGVPGALKNAIDWTISSSQFPHKPTLLITASTGGNYGHQALMETLRAIEAKNIEKLQMVVAFAKTKISIDNTITDQETLTNIKTLIADFIDTMNE
jgi:chromate reductase